MPEIIQDWLGTKLGVVVDMSPERFGRNTKDGTLLAKVLYNYGVIPAYVLNSVKESKNCYECYNNLIVLKPWLKYIGVIQEDSTLQKMAGGEGSAAISVFYSVYLNLERKDRLHYLSAQKERRISLESCDKFKVSCVPEVCITGESGEPLSKLTSPLFENPNMLEWHKAKCKQIVNQIRRVKAKVGKMKKKPELGPVVSKHSTSQPIDKRKRQADEAEETRENIQAFERNHPDKRPNLNFAELTELQKGNEMQPCFAPSMTEARNILSSIKQRKKGDTYARNFQQKMQHILLDEQWKEIIEKQDKDFESKVCGNLLKQSQYEKQMAKKLYLMRNHKKVLTENRRKIEGLKIDQCQKEIDERVKSNAEELGEYWEEEEIENERIQELHRRLYDEKVMLRRKMLKIECWKICEALADIAIRISEFRELISCQIPKTLMKDLKELFYKDLPIFDLLDHFEELRVKDSRPRICPGERGEEEEGEVDLCQSKEFEQLKSKEMDRQSILDECDFNDYMHLTGPWMVELLFPNGSEMEPKQIVLGYVVHKLLAVKYPPPNAPLPVDVKPMKPTSMVLGLNDETATSMLRDLMEACGILLVRVDDAINFVLAAYREELSVVRDIDVNFQNVTEAALQKRTSTEKEREPSRKIQLLKVETPAGSITGEDFLTLDKETQTPRMIPDDDPLLSPNAELGRQAFEALGAGDPVPDTVIASAVVAYVVSKQEEYQGWVLLNYPLLYSQASELEFFLTGYRTLPVVEETETLEDAEGFTYRGPWGSLFGRDAFGEYRLSKLVPKPDVLIAPDAEIPKTYFDSLIKLKKAQGTPRHRSQESEEFGPMEKFYSDLGIVLNFEYQTLNFQTVKNLGKQIIRMCEATDGSYSDVTQKTSVEIFGKVVLELNEKWEPKKKSTRDLSGVPKKEVKESSKVSVDYGGAVAEESDEDFEEEISGDKVPEMESSSPKPGDPTWEWATGPQPEELLLALAVLWENMEAVYIEDFRNVFFCLRVHRVNVVNYCGCIRKSLRILMRRPDEKQKVLGEFQQMFNEIDEDLRPDVDIKCELHVRVSELEQALMNFADERKRNSMNDATKVAQDGWVPDEMVNLVNTFLTALQLEVDRSVDSCQMIMDYYVSLQQKLPELKPLGKVIVPKLVAQDRKYSVSSSVSNKTGSSYSPRNSEVKRISKSEQSRFSQSKTRSVTDKKKRSCDSGLFVAGDFVKDVLTNLTLPDDGLTPFHTFFMDSVQTVMSEVKSVLESCIVEAKKLDKTAPSTTLQTKTSKKPSETNMASSGENLAAEWITALETELSRFVFRSQLILARGIFDLNEFLTMILNILSSLSEEVSEMYMREIHSISECCRVFRCGIEEEIPIQPVLELKEDEFIVHMDDVIPSKELTAKVEVVNDRYSFTMDQLNLLFYKLQRVAPDGEIIKRSFVYIIEDLRMLNPEVENCRCFPEVWNDIDPDDVTTIMNEVYQDLEIVPWKDFFIYALELPFPTEAEILTMRRLFRKYDPLVTELVARKHFYCVELWFENRSSDVNDFVAAEKNRQAKDLLYRMYQVNDMQTNYSALLLAFCKDENPIVGFEKALALAMGKAIEKYEESVADSIPGETQSFEYGLFDETNRDSASKPYCCPTPSTEVTVKCIPREKVVRCECKDETESSIEKSTEPSNYSQEDAGEEGYFYYSSRYREPWEASLIPYHILSSLLKASFPALPQLSILLDCHETFQETLSSIYDSLESYDNSVEVHKLIKHKFIHRLLHSTNKFKFVKLKEVLLSLAKGTSPVPPRVICAAEKPTPFQCLRN